MNKRFKHKYKIDAARLKNHDYSTEGFYFITILVKNREHFFGEIVDDKMILSELGKIVKEEWLISEKIRKNIYLDKWVIMPNHLHGIVIIDYLKSNKNRFEFKHNDFTETPIIKYTEERLNAYVGENPDLSKISPIPNSISTMIRFFKGKVKARSIDIEPQFDWQDLFYDVIIKDKESLFKIRKYIANNVKNWKDDELF